MLPLYGSEQLLSVSLSSAIALGEIAAKHSRKFLQNVVRAIGWLASAEFGPRPLPTPTSPVA